MENTIIILGGGISGLSLLWSLKKKYPNDSSIILLEKNHRVGGWIHSIHQEGFLFEQGPRSCRGSGKAVLELIEELDLQDQMIAADPSARYRYLYTDQKLKKLPSNLLGFLFSHLTRFLVPKLLKEWTIPAGQRQDESVNDFFSRRLGKKAVDLFVDSLTTGIFAGDIQQLSAKSCYSQLYNWERDHGSLLRGAFFNRFNKPKDSSSAFVKKWNKAGLFSFKEGMETLPLALAKKLERHIFTNHEVMNMHFNPDGITLSMKNGKTFEAKQVYSTLPAHALAPLIQPHNSSIADLLSSIKFASIAVVNLGYKSQILSKKGFGYLIPSKEKENILGAVWDSCVFPEQQQSQNETRLTVMIGGVQMKDFSERKEPDFLALALKAVEKHLKITCKPDLVNVTIARSAIPQYEVGHEEKVRAIQKTLQELSSHFKVSGSSFYGVSINDCVLNSLNLSI